uniref:S8 family serine peptidase n=1 Tax=Cellulosilyticum ruminicola TaxID=425254 RepID=UPI000ACE35FD
DEPKLNKKIFIFLCTATLLLSTSSISASNLSISQNQTLNNLSAKITSQITGQWNDSFMFEIYITNTGTDPIDDWQLNFDFDHEITNIWNASLINQNNNYIVKNLDWNSPLYLGQTLTVGFISCSDNLIELPTNYQLISPQNASDMLPPSPINNINEPFTLLVDQEHMLNLQTKDDELWYEFTPPVTGAYTITTTGNSNINSVLYDETKSKVIIDGTDRLTPSSLAATLLANETYYIKNTPINYDSTHTECNTLVQLIDEPNDPLFNQQWGLLNKDTGLDINILPIWNYTQGENIKIGMADTGAYYEHLDLRDRLNLNLSYNFTHDMRNVFPENEAYSDTYTAVYGHGTHVAGIIGASLNNNEGIAGIASKSDIIELKVLGRKLKGTTDYTKSIAAFVKAVEYTQENNIKILNCSFGGKSASQAEKDTMLAADDILFVIAAGNSRNDLQETPEYPACYYYPNSLVVASINPDGTLSDYSNYGGPTDIAAPGSQIISTTPYDLYDYQNGTSMATPFVSSVCSLV